MPTESTETPLVQRYLEAFGEVARLVSAAEDVPETVWEILRVTWDDMSPTERDVIERRTGAKR